ncbi:MAG: SUMF1/EgtB/PvdO family nonheme iron enzyme [Myxococcales bacterium]|nr:SUMF1/EgtB/PvdO family nonheme iron enzyme [Myxococcales bacterium]MCB9719169.1 SUMF1/EgtB/PvdO family nonheme iron enzyme [Myxococcales bacterium]
MFLSYASDQRELVNLIRSRLNGDGFSVFFDRKDIHYARSFDQTIREAIERSSVLVFLASPRSVHSDSYALYELGYAFDRWSEGSRASKRILTVVAAPTDGIPRELDERLKIHHSEVPSRLSDLVRKARRHDPRYRIRHTIAWTTAMAVALVALAGTAAALRHAPEIRASPSNTAPTSTTSISAPTEGVVAPQESVVESAPMNAETRSIELDDGAVLHFVHVPGGRAELGSPFPSVPGKPIEPRRELELPPFWLMRTEVTQAQWKSLMSEPPGGKPQNCTVGCERRHPVHHVHHDDAARFANALSERMGRRACYQAVGRGRAMARLSECDGAYLPWESQWEHAARAGTTQRFSFGDDVAEACTYANARDQTRRRVVSRNNMEYLPCDDGHAHLAAVASYQPNPWGLYDMHGNVWEWADVDTPGDDAPTILRGGSFLDTSNNLRSARRYRVGSGQRYSSVGFRIGFDRLPEAEEIDR